MKYIISMLVIWIAVTGCDQKDPLEAKKEELKTFHSEMAELKKKIGVLEEEIKDLDPDYKNGNRNAILVTSIEVKEDKFEHKIEIRGSVESKKNVIISSEIPGKINFIKVREGQAVSKGMVLVELDADVIRNNIAELKTSLDLATILYERQSKLWDKNIGTEIQYLEAKNRKESLERRLATANSELDRAVIRAPFSGSIDEVVGREGELVQPGSPLIRIVNPDEVYIKSDISERFIGKFKKGDNVEVYFPTQERSLMTTVTSVSQVINKENRTFEMEIHLPKLDFILKPNQVAVLKLVDYSNTNALAVPTKLIQRDDKGNYLYEVKKEEGYKCSKEASH